MRTYYHVSEKITTPGNASGVLTNGYGSYFAFDESLSYQGWYAHDMNDWSMYKIIESITPASLLPSADLDIFPHALRRTYADANNKSGATIASETFMLYSNILLYETTHIDVPVTLTLDPRQSYGGNELGRFVRIYEDHNALIIEQTVDGRTLYLAIKGYKGYNKKEQWKEKHYSFDAQRSACGTYWVYEAIDFIPGNRMVFAYGKTLHDALSLASVGACHFESLQQQRMQASNFELTTGKKRSDLVVQLAHHSLSSLTQQFASDHNYFKGIYAGLPWFFQIWSRDELISLGGLLQQYKQQDKLDEYKQILQRHISSILPNGQLANRYPHSDLGSIDAFGWLAFRVQEFLTELGDDVFSYVDAQELVNWLTKFKKGLANAKQHRGESGLFYNEFNETWMDTSFHDNGREGYCIEIQALYFAVHKVIFVLAQLVEQNNLDSYHQEMNLFKEKILHSFYKEDNLIDTIDTHGIVDKTLRPNMFLAAHVAPELLSSTQWESVFDKHLAALSTHWGSLTTIPKDHPLFCPRATGQTNESYHRGDTWYFVNHIAALALLAVNKQKYEQTIHKIILASSKDMLELGFAGHMSEISSAQVQDAQGCFAQAWSVGTFLELAVKYYN
jgi:glycogen debranching enzyme